MTLLFLSLSVLMSLAAGELLRKEPTEETVTVEQPCAKPGYCDWCDAPLHVRQGRCTNCGAPA